jgi:hypothetical protein
LPRLLSGIGDLRAWYSWLDWKILQVLNTRNLTPGGAETDQAHSRKHGGNKQASHNPL